LRIAPSDPIAWRPRKRSVGREVAIAGFWSAQWPARVKDF